MSDGSFKSTGTIRVRIKESDGTSSAVFFTPNDDSTVRCDGKTYAVFSPTGEAEIWLRSKPLSDSGEGVRINVAVDFPGLTEAAIQQKLVEVEVTEGGTGADDKATQIHDTTLTLRAITIPAPGKQK